MSKSKRNFIILTVCNYLEQTDKEYIFEKRPYKVQNSLK